MRTNSLEFGSLQYGLGDVVARTSPASPQWRVTCAATILASAFGTFTGGPHSDAISGFAVAQGELAYAIRSSSIRALS